MHDYLRTVIVAPMTSAGRPAPYRIPLRFSGKKGLILVDQIRSLDKTRLVKRVGTVSSVTLRATLYALQQTFAA
jgi:mRNA interferase MazF